MRYESVNIANNNDVVAPLFTVKTQFIKAAPRLLTDSRLTVVDKTRRRRNIFFLGCDFPVMFV